MQEQTIFDFLYDKYKITNKVRLIELFAGIGSQAKALKNIGADFEHYKVVEFDKYAIASYNAIHNTNFLTLDITKIKGSDLEIVDTNKFTYLLTYSFPCQDLSLAGKQKGMSKDSNTRSGLLWEVERLLNEIEELPQVLLMENVPQVHSKDNIQDFQKWILALEKLGYKSYWKDLNAKNYEIPQNRNRTFMISILGDYNYKFPKKQKLKLRLKDMLEDEVDEKYYLSDKMIQSMIKTNYHSYKLENALLNSNGIANTILAKFEGCPQCIQIPEATKKGYAYAEDGDGVYINRPHQKRGVVQKQIIQTLKTQCDDLGVVVLGNYSKSNHEASRIVDLNGLAPTFKDNHGTVNAVCLKKDTQNYIEWEEEGKLDIDCRAWKENCIAPTTTTPKTKVLQNNLQIRKLTPKECFRLMGFSDEDFEKASKVNSNAQLYKQAGNSIVVNVLEAIFKELF